MTEALGLQLVRPPLDLVLVPCSSWSSGPIIKLNYNARNSYIHQKYRHTQQCANTLPNILEQNFYS